MEERRRFGAGRGGFRGGGRFPPKPVEIGKEYEVDIQELSRRGEGIARIEGFVIFVPNTKQGDHVKIKVTRISRRFAEAQVVGEAKVAEEPAPAEEPPKEEAAEEPPKEVAAEEPPKEEAAEEPPKEEEAKEEPAPAEEPPKKKEAKKDSKD
jgi:predicted RNA-binding protein with TRAM domain